VGPVLPGHDATPEVLARLGHEDWLSAVREELAGLRAEHREVHLVGLSLGGLLSLALAAEERVEAVVVIGTPLRFRRAIRWTVPVLKHFVPFLKKGQGSDIRDAEARRRHPSFPVMPLASVHQLMALQARVVAALPRVRAPILVAHGSHDATADPADARAIYEGVGSERRELLLLPDSGHVVPVDRGGPRLAQAVVEHLRSGG
jgi:carboxylesterase